MHRKKEEKTQGNLMAGKEGKVMEGEESPRKEMKKGREELGNEGKEAGKALYQFQDLMINKDKMKTSCYSAQKVKKHRLLVDCEVSEECFREKGQ